MQCYSHPDKELVRHLTNVLDIGMNVFKSKQINISIDKRKIELALKNMLFYHDLGKATTYFQKYLKAKINNTNYNFIDRLKNHALISALYSAYKTFLEIKKGFNEKNYILPIIVFAAIEKHHGNLANMSDAIMIDEKEEILKEQWNSINWQCINEKKPEYDIDDILGFFEDVYFDDSWKPQNNNISGYEAFLLLNLFFSILTYADKSDVAIKQYNITDNFKDIDIIDRYRQKQFSNKDNSNINTIRNEIYNKAAVNISTISDNILALNVPTGTGKTLTAINLALKLMKGSNFHRIIYALPFTSIIEQTQMVLENVFSSNGMEFKDWGIVHHHLADIKIKMGEDYITGDEAQLLIEHWDKPIILTTFWQILNAIFYGYNSLIRKFHNIANSIIILDEIQSINYKYWYLLNQFLPHFTKHLNNKIILLTATMPLIFKDEEINYIISKDDRKHYYKAFSRYTIFNNKKLHDIYISDMIDIAIEHINREDRKDFLFVLNTIKSSIEFFNGLKDRLRDSGSDLIYLSTNIVPSIRSSRIRHIKGSKNRKIIVSTQVIEAGVDIDVDIVYRDFAPLDAIIQTAGRCNRNAIKDNGEVYIMKLKSDKDKYFCKYVYSPITLQSTEIVISDKGRIDEGDLLELIEKYYRELKRVGSSDESRNIISAINELNYKDIQRDFRLIEDRGEYKISVFVEISEHASNVLSKYKEIINIEDNFERKSKMSEIKRQFYMYVLSLPDKDDVRDKLSSFEELGSFYIITSDMLNQFYDNDTGFIFEYDRVL